jgi:hypothetical protein
MRKCRTVVSRDPVEKESLSPDFRLPPTLKLQHWPLRRRIKGRHMEHAMLEELDRHGSRLCSVFADHHQLGFLIGDSRIRSQRCKDAAVTPVADLQWQKAAVVMVQDQPDLARVRAEAAAIDNDRGQRFHRKLPAN